MPTEAEKAAADKAAAEKAAANKAAADKAAADKAAADKAAADKAAAEKAADKTDEQQTWIVAKDKDDKEHRMKIEDYPAWEQEQDNKRRS